jgi:hypothetical protein
MTAIAGHSCSRRIRAACALSAAAFLFFLLSSTPHRVHHVFQQIEAANHRGAHDHHGDSKRQNSSSNETDCVFQVSANRCAIGLAPLIQPLALTRFVQRLFISQDKTNPRQFLSAAFQIRAPPKA